MTRFAETVKKEAEVFRGMVEAGMLTEREVELLELAGLDIAEKGNDREGFEILKPLKTSRKPRDAPRPRKHARKPGETQKLGSFILLSKPVKVVQDRLRF